MALALLALPVAAQSTRARLDELDLRVGQLEETLRGQALVELSQRLDTLETEARALRGDLEVLQKDADALRRQQSDLARDFDRRIAALESRLTAMAAVTTPAMSASGSVEGMVPAAAVTVPAATVPPIASVAPIDSPEVVYGRAFDALKAAKYPEAIAGMNDFILRYPSHPLADNAQYWLAQAHFVTRDYAKALEAFVLVFMRSPESSKAPDALLKKGLCEIELRRTEAARSTFNEVIQRYPQNDAARLAREQLARLR